MCDKPVLLQNRTAFPDSVFFGPGSRYPSNARFTESGWCNAIRKGQKYLLIDLQKEYHITRVVTMGNKNQTKWIGRYAIAYSNDKSFRNKRQVFVLMGEYFLKFKILSTSSCRQQKSSNLRSC